MVKGERCAVNGKQQKVRMICNFPFIVRFCEALAEASFPIFARWIDCRVALLLATTV